MIDPHAKLSAADFARIVALHQEALPESLVTALGSSLVEAYYHFIVDSAEECLFLVRDAGIIVGACILSWNSGSETQRFVASCRTRFGWAVVRACLTSAQFRRKLYAMLFGAKSSPAQVRELPEIVQIFTDAACRNQQIGTGLLAQTERFLLQRGSRRYFIKTAATSENQALHFYRKRHFVEAGEGSSFGKHYLYFTKEIDVSAVAGPLP